MGIFSNSTPFDADVEKATDEKNTSEEWGRIMEICDKVGSSSTNSKDCLQSIVKRLQNPDPHVVLQAITLLDACINNCGKTFQLEVASRDFDGEIKKLVTKWRTGPVGEKLRQLIKKWSEAEWNTDPQLGLMSSLYSRLKSEGIDVSVQPEPQTKRAPVSTNPDSVASQQEVDDIARAIELSLKESSSPKYNGLPKAGAGTGSSSGLYPSVSSAFSAPSQSPQSFAAPSQPPSAARKVKALYDFEAAEDNELTFFTGEIIHVTDDSDANWWKGYNQRGEGLFPANFVTADLSEPTEREKKGVGFSETVEVREIAEVREIDEEKIERALSLLHEADPQSQAPDSEELIRLEAEVTQMGPLIDTELEKVDRKHAQLTQLSSSLVEALNLYHGLMREPKPAPQWYPPPPPALLYRGPHPPPGVAPLGPPHPHQLGGGPPAAGPHPYPGPPHQQPLPPVGLPPHLYQPHHIPPPPFHQHPPQNPQP